MPKTRSICTLINDFVGTSHDGCLWFLLNVFMVISSRYVRDFALPHRVAGIIYRHIFASYQDELRNDSLLIQ